jgi:hypothetical protein
MFRVKFVHVDVDLLQDFGTGDEELDVVGDVYA